MTTSTNTSPRKVAIVGFSKSTRHLAPFDDPSYEIWGINYLFLGMPQIPKARWSRWLDMHPMSYLEKYHTAQDWQTLLKWYETLTVPLYMPEQVKRFPTCKAYPLQDIIRGTGMLEEYFESTIAYAIGMAISEGVDVLDVYGSDMVHDTEWGHQRPNAEHLLGIAVGRGIQLNIPSASALLTPKWRYGYEERPPCRYGDIVYAVEHMRDDSRRKINETLRVKVDQALCDQHTHEGFVQAMEQVLEAIRQAERGRKLTAK